MDWDLTVNELKIELDTGKTLNLSEFARVAEVAASVLGEDAVVVTEHSSAKGSYTFQRKGWAQEKELRYQEQTERWRLEAEKRKKEQ